MLWRIEGENGLSMQTLIVTGGTGFIGGNFMRHAGWCAAVTRGHYDGGRLGLGAEPCPSI